MWRHSSIAYSRAGQLSSSAPEVWPLGQIVPPWWNRLPFVAVIASFQPDTILGATGAAAVSH
jgi:hypothetical protein